MVRIPFMPQFPAARRPAGCAARRDARRVPAALAAATDAASGDAPPSDADAALDAASSPFDAERPSGPGWFDSSWDLGHGLEVREDPFDAAGLHAWLQACAQPVGRGARDAAPRAVPARGDAPDPFRAFDIDALELAGR